MGFLTENEIFDCLRTNFRLAAEHCDALAVLPAKGPTYNLFRHELKLIEGACRQASAWREDTRWLPIGLMMHETHQRVGNWLRARQPGILFARMAENLRNLEIAAINMQTKATGRIGMILPDAYTRPKSSLILPSNYVQ